MGTKLITATGFFQSSKFEEALYTGAKYQSSAVTCHHQFTIFVFSRRTSEFLAFFRFRFATVTLYIYVVVIGLVRKG